jgi:hypothetical protein
MNSDAFNKNLEQQKNKIDVLDKIFYIVEETLFYKINEMEEDTVFTRKLVLKLLKNQKNSLAVSIENN